MAYKNMYDIFSERREYIFQRWPTPKSGIPRNTGGGCWAFANPFNKSNSMICNYRSYAKLTPSY